MPKINLRYAAIVVVGLAAFGAGKALVLNANESDLRYQKFSVSEGQLNGPVLGGAFAYNHISDQFEPQMICELVVGGSQVGPHPVSIHSSSLLAMGWNGAMNSVTEYVGDKIGKAMQISGADAKWQFQKRFWRAQNGTSFDETCRAKVEAKARDPNYSVFLVETIFFDQEALDDMEMVQLSQTSVVFSGCEPDCQAPVPVKSVLDAGWLTRSKDDWGIVRIQ